MGLNLDGFRILESTRILFRGAKCSQSGNFFGGNIGISKGTAWVYDCKTQFKTTSGGEARESKPGRN